MNVQMEAKLAFPQQRRLSLHGIYLHVERQELFCAIAPKEFELDNPERYAIENV